MDKIQPLNPEQLYTSCPSDHLDFATTDELVPLETVFAQERASDALKFGTGIQQHGYNMYVQGPSGLGKHSVIKRFLQERASESPPPADWCYVNNFDDSNKPDCIELPPGYAMRFKKDMDHLIDDLQTSITAAFDSTEYQNQVSELDEEFRGQQEKAFNELREEAEKSNIALLRTPVGFAFTPVKDGEVVSPEEYEKLDEKEQKEIEAKVEKLQGKLQEVLRNIPRWRKEAKEKLKELDRSTADMAVKYLIEDLKNQYKDVKEVSEYLESVHKDVVENIGDFQNKEESSAMMLQGIEDSKPSFRRYRVNVLVDHDEETSRPVVYEDNPTFANLVGRIEHLAHMGALLTDFMLIKPGALHRANGGYLVIDAFKLLIQPYAWEGLKRALYSREINIESISQMLSLVSTVSLEPEPVPLDIKVILIGDRRTYYLLYRLDPDFEKLFKVSVDFEGEVERSEDITLQYARLIAGYVKSEKLRPMTRDAVARVIEDRARYIEDAERYSTHLEGVSELVAEADYWAGEENSTQITDAHVIKAIAKKKYRSDRVHRQILDEIQRRTLFIDTGGEKTGQVNGLTIIELGGYLFGTPARITATARLGEGELVDIEREVELGGAIHSKGVLILSKYISSRYCLNKPLSLMASLVMEQSYGMVDGDSASVAECSALLSVLSGIPIKQNFSVTGSVNQLGEVQPIGGVNEKIEGFFEVCRARGLNGEHAVIIPDSNIKHLMLHDDVIQAVAAGKFHIYAVATVDEAITLLTGRPAGQREAQGRFPPDSVNGLVEKTLEQMADLRHEFSEHEKDKEDDSKSSDNGKIDV